MSYTESKQQVWLPFPEPLPSDAGQCQWRGGYVGCGPQVAATLLLWWGERLGLEEVVAGPAPTLARRDALAAALAPAVGAWLVPFSGRLRAVQPWTWLLGLNRSLAAQGLPLRARGHWGYRPDLAARLAHNWAAGVPTAGFEFSARTQHYGLLNAYARTPQGLEGRLIAPLMGAETLHLQPRLGAGGVFWLELR